MDSRPPKNIPGPASQCNGRSSFQRSEPPAPSGAAAFAAPENAQVRNGLPFDRFLRRVSFCCLLVARNPTRSAVRYPAGDERASILLSMAPNSRRVRWLSAKSNQ